MLTREDILKTQDIVTETVSVPEWGGEVTVRSLTAEEARTLFAFGKSKRGPDEDIFMVPLVAAAVMNGDGKAMFTLADVEVLRHKSHRAIMRIFDAACRINGFGSAGAEEARKNSATPTNGSGIA